MIYLQVGNLGLLFMLLFFIYAALGVELFGKLGKFSSIKVCHREKLESLIPITSPTPTQKGRNYQNYMLI